mmetsp:Transcript_59846/g.192655  ORF Transcript_59846/g.192655 Transcript_59846/m.192655 type:complete len:140 (+) Transcript_59846:133-552(+)
MRGTIHDPLEGQSREVIAAKQWAPVAEFERRRQQELQERRVQRMAEGGRGGGLNDRQTVVEKGPAPPPDEDGYDDFGRRVAGRSGVPADGAKSASSQRATAALERLRQRATGDRAAGHGARSRSRSRSPRPSSGRRQRI